MAKIEREETYPDFLITPHLLFRDTNIEPIDRIVYATVYWYAQLKGGVCEASNIDIARIAGIEPRSVQNALNRLETRGYIKRSYKDEKRRNRIGIETKINYGLWQN